MKNPFTLSYVLKFFLLAATLACINNKALAQPAACNLQGANNTPWEFMSLAFDELYPQDITIGTTSPTYTFVAPSSNYTGLLDLASSVSFAVTAGTTVPVTTDLYEGTFLGIYVDWDHNGNFDGQAAPTLPNGSPNPLFIGYDEYINSAVFNTGANFFSGTQAFSGSISIPPTIPSGSYRARIVFGYNDFTNFILPGVGNGCANWAAGTLANEVFQEVAALDVTLAVTNPATCFPPQPPFPGAIGANSAVLNWNPPSTVNNGYQYILVASGGSPSSPWLASGYTPSSFTTINSLTPLTNYNFYVRAGCSATDSSAWAGPLSFTTLAPLCTGTPNTPSITVPPGSTFCGGSSATLTASNVNTAFSGITYQWAVSTSPTSGFIAAGTGLSYTPVYPVGGPTVYYYTITAKCTTPPTYTSLPSATVFVNVKSYSIPYTEDFSTTPNGAEPLCYEVDVDAPGGFATNHSFTAADGTPFSANAAPFNNVPVNAKNSYFTIPPLILSNSNTYTIQFNYARSNANFRQRLQLYANTLDPGTVNFPGSPAITGGVKLLDIADTVNNVSFAKLTFTPPLSGTYYFSWYDSSAEASSTANGTGQAVGNIAIYIAQPCVRPTVQPTALNFTSNVSSISGTFTPASPAPDKYLVVRTLGTTPLSGFTPADAAYYYVNQAAGNGTIVYAGKNANFIDQYLSSGAQYTYTVFAYNDLCSAGPLYDVTNPLTGTFQTTGGNVYVWNQAVAGDYQVAANWTPNRNVLDPSDVLIFNNATADTVNNVPAQNIGQLQIINNTGVRMRASSSAPSTLTMLATTSTTNVLVINTNSSLIADGTGAPLTLAFGGANATATINGNLEVQNTGAVNILNFLNCTATVGAAGTLAAGGSVGTQAITFAGPANLIMNGTYNHKYTIVVGGTIPLATWNTGSTVLISGYSTAALSAGPGNLNNQTFYNFTYNCSNQTANVLFAGMTVNTAINILGTFTMASTGTGSLQLAAGTYYRYNVNNYTQTGGTLDLGTGTPTIYQQTFNVSGTFNQTGGILKSTNSSTTIGAMLNFTGTAGTQNVNFFNAAPVGPITYQVSNYNGINLTGTGTLNSTFALNGGGGMRISTSSPNPVTTSLVLTYAATASTLTYDSALSRTATANVWPSANGPFNVTVFVGYGNAVKVPFSRTIGGILNFVSGDLDFNSNTLTLGTGTATANIGTITGINGQGFIRLTTGAMTRWFPTSGLPANNSLPATGSSYTAAGIGYFPISYGFNNRNVYTYFTSATGLSAGGTITVSHNSAPGLIPVTVTDNSYTIQQRTAAFWSFATGNGIALASGATMGVRITSANLFNPLNPANLHILRASTASAGTHVTGGGTTPLVYAERNGLLLSDLTAANLFVGANSADIAGGIWTAINTGNWTTGSTWDQGTQPPTPQTICVINPGVTVTVNSTLGSAIKVLTNNGTLNISASTLTIDSALYNNDTVTVSATGTLKVNGNGTVANTAVGVVNNGWFVQAGGTTTLGPVGGGNKPFTSNGVLNVSAGTLNINGSFLVNGYTTTSPFAQPNSTFVQSGGSIVVDGNAGGNTAASVAAATPLVSFRSPNLTLTGGTITIADPHANTTTATNAFEYNVNTTNAPFYNYSVPVLQSNVSAAHTFIFGDGTSADAGGNSTYGFRVNVLAAGTSGGRFNFGNVIVNGPSAGNRFVGLGVTSGSSTVPTGFLGNITVNSGGELRANTTGTNSSATGVVALKNNLTVNTGGTLTCAFLYFADYTNGSNTLTLPASPTQTVSGGGLFRNSTSAPTASGYANFYTLAVSGGSNPTILDSLSFAGNLNFSSTMAYPNTGGTLLSHIIVPNISNYRITEISGAGASSIQGVNNGWVVGAYQKHANAGGFPNTYPVGDMLYYTPPTLGPSGAVTTGGDVYVRVTQGLEPNIASSTLNPLKTVKRYVTVGIPAGNPIAFTSGVLTVQPTWVTADLPVGANTNIFNPAQDYIPAGSTTPTGTWSYPSAILRQQLAITATGLTNFTGNYAVGETCPPSSINVHPLTNTVCSGHADTLKVVGTGLGLTYQWYRGAAPAGTAITGATSANYIVPAATQADSGAYYVIMGGICAAPLTSTGATINVTSGPSITTQPVSSVVCVGGADTVAVTATGTAPISYQWYQNGIALAPSTFRRHFIANAALGNAGGYTVAVTNSCGSITSNIATVTVSPLPAATITSIGSTTACAGSSVVLQAPVGNITYVWTVNGVASGYNSRYDTVSTTGGVNVTVTSAAGCTSSSTIADTVHIIAPPPAIIATTSNPTFCLPGSVVLYADTMTGYSYSWLKNNSVTGLVGSYYTALTSGSYQVIVTNSYNCSATSAPITVSANPLPTPTITASGPTTFCQNGTPVVLNTPNGASYPTPPTWTNLNTGVPVAGTDPVTGATITASGSYEVTVTDANGCSGTSSPIVVTVNPLPAAIATAQGPTSICPGNSVILVGSTGTDPNVTYQWFNGATPATSASATGTYTATNAGLYTVRVRETVTGCINTSNPSINVVIATPTASITPAGAQTLCAGSTTTLIANAGASYQWFLNGTTPLVNTQTINATQGGTYTVAVTNTSGCTATSASKTLTIVPLPVAAITAGGPTTFCAGGSVLLAANTGTGLHYTWTGGATTQTLPAGTSGVYNVIVTDENNCTNTSNSITVNAVAYPVATLTSGGLPTSICAGSNVLLTAGPIGNSYLWLFNGTPLPFSDPNRASMSYPATQTGTYSVTVTNSTGCASTVSAANALSVFVNPVPHVKTLGPSEFCWGSSDVLSVDGGPGTGLAYQWYNNGAPMVGATGTSLTVFDSGVYTAVVTVVGSCAQTTPNNIKVIVDGLPLPSIVGSGNHVATTGTYNHYQWFNGSTPLTGDTLSSLVLYDAGNYHVVVTNSKGCDGVSNVYKYGTTGVGTVNKDDINIYPNPVSSIVHIDAPMPVDATVVTVDGRLVLQSVDVKVMDMAGLANGIYMIRVYDKAGALVKVEKLVKASN